MVFLRRDGPSYLVMGAAAAAAHSSIAAALPHDAQRTIPDRAWHEGQLPCASNTSSGARQAPQTHSGPAGGAVRQDGHA